MTNIPKQLHFLFIILLLSSCIDVPILPFEPGLRAIEIIEVNLKTETNPVTRINFSYENPDVESAEGVTYLYTVYLVTEERFIFSQAGDLLDLEMQIEGKTAFEITDNTFSFAEYVGQEVAVAVTISKEGFNSATAMSQFVIGAT